MKLREFFCPWLSGIEGVYTDDLVGSSGLADEVQQIRANETRGARVISALGSLIPVQPEPQ